jgi:hypothetical protein
MEAFEDENAYNQAFAANRDGHQQFDHAPPRNQQLGAITVACLVLNRTIGEFQDLLISCLCWKRFSSFGFRPVYRANHHIGGQDPAYFSVRPSFSKGQGVLESRSSSGHWERSMG